jgi:hypothetical protein
VKKCVRKKRRVKRVTGIEKVQGGADVYIIWKDATCLCQDEGWFQESERIEAELMLIKTTGQFVDYDEKSKCIHICRSKAFRDNNMEGVFVIPVNTIVELVILKEKKKILMGA